FTASIRFKMVLTSPWPPVDSLTRPPSNSRSILNHVFREMIMMKTVDLEASANNLLDLECCPRPLGARDQTAVLELYAPDITYFDPLTPTSIDGDEAMEKYYQPFAG